MVVSFLWPKLFWPAIVVAVLVGVSRLAVGMHYPTDVVAGAVLGTMGAYLVRLYFARRGWVFARAADGSVERRKFALQAG
jgi:undecaprenyl-diphosphatase